MYLCKQRKPTWKEFRSFCFHSKYIIFVVYGLFICLYFSGLYQKLYKSVDGRIQYHAVPIAISTLYQEHKHDYRGWLSTERPFQGIEGILKDNFIKEQIAAPVNKEAGHYYWVADDRGYADYVIAAFALFGPHMKSLYHFWFLILFLSITLFIISFNKHVWALGYLGLLLLGLHSAISLLKLMHVAIPVYEPRYLETLALVPIIHLIFTAIFIERKSFCKHLIPLLGQVAIFIFLYHARSSLGWEILVVVLVSLVSILIKREWNKIFVPLTIALLLILSSTVLLSSYKRFTYHPSYFKNMGPRTFWHNVLMGLRIKAWSVNLVSDHAVAELVIEYAKQSGCTSQIKELSGQDLLNTLGNWGTANWKEYEYWARKLFLSLIMHNKLEVARLYLVQKPLNAIKEVINPKVILFSESTRTQSLNRALTWNPLHLFYLVPFLFVVFLAGESLYVYRWKLLMLTSITFFCSMIPPVVFYSDILTHGGMSVMMVVILYLGIMICLSYVYFAIINFYNRSKTHET